MKKNLHLQSEVPDEISEHLSLLYNTSCILNSSLDIEKILDTLIDMMIEAFDGERGFIMLFDNSEKTLKIMVARNMEKQNINEQDFSISTSVARRVFETGKAILSDNATLDSDICSYSILMNEIRGILCVPIKLKDKIIGVFYTDSRIKEGTFDDKKKDLLIAIAAQAATAIENARLYNSLEKSEKKYRAIFENVIEGIFQSTPEGKLLIVNPAFAKIFGYFSHMEVLTDASNIVDYYVERDTRRTIRDLIKKDGFIKDFEVKAYRKDKTVIDVSINVKGVLDEKGQILYYEGLVEDITQKKQAEEVKREKDRIGHELSLAHKIQMSIIPQRFPAFPERKDIDIFARTIPALEVGGDFYDFMFIDKEHLAFVIGDAAGKGIPGAFFMSISRAFLKATALKGYDPGECLGHVNDLLCSENYMDMFITIFYGILNTRTGELRYCNGGHNEPYLFRKDGTIEILKTCEDPMLGFFSGVSYNTVSVDVGDGIFLYTDGVTEAFNINGKVFSDERLYEILKGIKEFKPEELINRVFDEVKRFSYGAPQSDDITILAVKYAGLQ